MFKTESGKLQHAIDEDKASTEPQHQAITPNIESILNLSTTMDSLLGNIFNLIEESRS